MDIKTPECPAEYQWMKPDEIGIQILSQQFVIIQSEPAYMCREWRVTVDYPDSAFGERTRNLSIKCDVLKSAKSDRAEIVSDMERLRNFRLFDLVKIEAQNKETESLRARLEEAEARVKELGDSLLQAQQDRITNSSQWSAMYDEIARQRNENLDRALKAEIQASELAIENERLTNSNGEVWKWSCEVEFESKQLKSKLAQVKALLGTEIMDLALSNLADLLNFDNPQYILLWSGRREQMPALLSAISEVKEVLQ